MITLFRLMILKFKKTKWELALWMFLDKELTTLAKNPEEIEKKLVGVLAQLIHDDVSKEKLKEAMGTYMEK